MKMKSTRALSLSILLAVIGSLLTAFASNLFFSDILSIAAISSNPTILITLPILFLALCAIAGFFYVLRLYKRPGTKKALTTHYLILFIVFNVLGAVTSLVGGLVTYGTLLAPYPFNGYCLVMMIIHLLMLVYDVLRLFKVCKKPADTEVFKVKVSYVFSTIGWFLFACLAFNRFGTFLVSPTFISWQTFYMTFVYYLFLISPVLIAMFKVMVDLGFFKDKKRRVTGLIILLAYTVVTGVATAVIGLLNPVFVSAVSVSMPLERLAAKPVEFPIHFIATIAVGVILLAQALKKKEEK